MGEVAQIVTAVCTLLTTLLVPIIGGYFLLRQAEVKNAFELAKEAAKEAASKVEEVKKTLAVTTAQQSGKIDQVLTGNEKIHKLVNAAMTAQLRINSDQARRIAIDNPADGAAQLAATAAEKLYRDHEAGQAAINTAPPPSVEGVTTVTAPVLVLPPENG